MASKLPVGVRRVRIVMGLFAVRREDKPPCVHV